MRVWRVPIGLTHEQSHTQNVHISSKVKFYRIHNPDRSYRSLCNIVRRKNLETLFLFSSDSWIANVYKILVSRQFTRCQQPFLRSCGIRTRKASRIVTIRAPVFQTMKEYRLGMHTNAWNALRYSVITLAVVPSAEKSWSRFHSRRTCERVIRGRTARLRQTRLAHWGLHQEVDEESKLSRLSAIFVCMLHIAGALLVEYGSDSAETYLFKHALVSPSLTGHGGLRPNGVYFVDAGHIWGKPDGLSECIDVGPRNLGRLWASCRKNLYFSIRSQLPNSKPEEKC